MSKADRDKRYRERHKAEISLKRKLKYRMDKDFREKRRKIERDRYHMNKQRERHVQPKVVSIDGAYVKLYPVGSVAEECALETYTVRAWLTGGIIPQPTLEDDAGRHWFSQEYIDKLKTGVAKYNETGERGLHVLKEIMDS